MTTIAYKNGELAFDSIVTEGEQTVGHMRKAICTDRFLAAAAGDSDAVQAFLHWVAKDFDAQYKPKLTKSEDFTGWTIDAHGRLTEYSWKMTKLRYTALCYSIGSGSQYAIGAMYAGADAFKAVEIAADHDQSTGGEILCYRLEDILGKAGKAAKANRSRNA